MVWQLYRTTPQILFASPAVASHVDLCSVFMQTTSDVALPNGLCGCIHVYAACLAKCTYCDCCSCRGAGTSTQVALELRVGEGMTRAASSGTQAQALTALNRGHASALIPSGFGVSFRGLVQALKWLWSYGVAKA